MADFTLVVGTVMHCIPSASLGGNPVAFPADTVFEWLSSDPSVTFTDPASASPDITGTTPLTDVTVKLNATQGGFPTVSKTHTLDVVAAPVQNFDAVDFSIQ